jgi:hypothetical protein
MKTHIQTMLAVLLGFLRPSRKCQTRGEFLSTTCHRDLGQQEFEKFIYW